MTGDFQIDWDRSGRTGVPEAVLCAHKNPAQISAIAVEAVERGKRLLFTRLDEAGFAALDDAVRAALDYHPLSRTAMLGGPVNTAATGIGIVAAGTSDMPAAREAARTLGFCGHEAPIIADVGV